MKRYRLLRDNREFGPLLLGELRSFGLYNSDLIWIEGESHCWEYPTKIAELKTLVQKRPKKPVVVAHESPLSAKEKLVMANQIFGESEANNGFPETSGRTAQEYFSATKERIEFRSKPRKLNLTAITTNLFGLGILLVGVMMGAFVVKKIVEHFESEPIVASANALEIMTEPLPMSTGNYAAKSILPSASTGNPTPNSTQADSVRMKPVQTKQLATVAAVNTEVPITQAEPEKSEILSADNPEQQSEVLNEAVPEPKVEKPEAAEVVKKVPSLSLAANEYKVGVFGGITDLEIIVNNPSTVPVNKAVVEVEFLKPNGSVVKTQTLSIENISPGSTKKISVPSSNRGVSVRYRIIDIDV